LVIFEEYINTINNILKIKDNLDAKYLMRECSNGLSSQTSDGRTESTRRYKSGGRDKMIERANKHFDFKINTARNHLGIDIDDPNEITFFSRS
jgi:predicted RNA-binding protein with RPS1 domain